jgi:hypothetical protein
VAVSRVHEWARNLSDERERFAAARVWDHASVLIRLPLICLVVWVC